ncbi:hypothetical protein CHLRE_01g014950v5 [Chlamydomonas reinhardtii]|nr:uncharacterized protein CHLRE_01g014950v5 [Chlamydomonas reinhardtii]PNW88116.1 hypothetical protein CHLRE_01g014950v5 [Chlamydomonas reinhardtii]
MGSYACRQVVPVDEKPSQLLALADCADTAVDTEDVQLQDGMQLAMVVGAEGASKKIEKSVETLQGLMKRRIGAHEYESAEWALAYLARDQGAKRWCFKKISCLVGITTTEIDIDGMAFSNERVVLVERKPRIELMHVSDLRAKVDKLILLVEAGAPNTAMLRNPVTGRIKPLKVFLMADSWADDPGEVAASAMVMEEYGIAPLLPIGNGAYAEHDSCDRWPVNDSTRRRGKEYLAARMGCGAQRPSSGAGVDASTGSGAGGGALGPNSAVGGQRHASSQQQAACSPAHPTHRLRAHDTFRATGSGCGLRRSVVPVCRPLHQHLSSSMPSLLRRL